MELLFENELSEQFEGLEAKYRRLAETAFTLLEVDSNYEIDVSLVDEETIQAINRDYRNVDRVTDVISFAFNDDKDPKDQIKGKDSLRMLGEILICLPQAKRQAASIGNSIDRELSFLFVHGLLHLLGYDHQTKEDEEKMFPLQEKILEEEAKR